MTYRRIWRQARAGAYPQSPRGVAQAWADLARASRFLVRWPLMVIVLGYGQPSLLSEDRH